MLTDNNLKFLFIVPAELNDEIRRVSSLLHQSKSAFVRDAVRHYIDEMEDTRLGEKSQAAPKTNESNSLIAFCRSVWEFCVVRFFFELVIVLICSYIFWLFY
jgi:predicted DNA-binding protein